MTTWKVEVTNQFQIKLIQAINFIAQDKPKAANDFKKDILKRIKNLSSMPYRNRQSIYFENENIRELIFKGYTIIYEISDKEVTVFSIIKHQIKP